MEHSARPVRGALPMRGARPCGARCVERRCTAWMDAKLYQRLWRVECKAKCVRFVPTAVFEQSFCIGRVQGKSSYYFLFKKGGRKKKKQKKKDEIKKQRSIQSHMPAHTIRYTRLALLPKEGRRTCITTAYLIVSQQRAIETYQHQR